MNEYTAIIKETKDWWIGWIEEVPGVNCQGATRAELLKNLESALPEAIELYREEAMAAAGSGYQKLALKLKVT
jgi:predicted RNase H-like HicB family nuclease